jgi:predicted MFS family arabinose efflux permease
LAITAESSAGGVAGASRMWAVISLAIGSVVPILGMPIIVEGLVDHWHLAASDAGYVTAVDLAGVFVGSTLTSGYANRVHWRGYLTVALLLAASFNACCVLHPTPLVLKALRFGAGATSGAAYASSLTLLCRERDRAKAFSWMIFSQVVANAVILAVFPSIDDSAGPAGMFAAVGALLVLTLAVMPLIPGRLPPPAAEYGGAEPKARPSLLAALCLAAIALVYVAIGSYWAYAERMGVAAGISANWVHRFLSVGVLLSAAGCFVAFRISKRLGQSRPLLGALGALAAVLLIDSGWPTALMYVIALGTLQLCWNFIDIFQLGTLAVVDPSGRAAALVPAAQGVALFAGPAAAGLVLDLGRGYPTVLAMAGISASLAAICYALVHLLHARGWDESHVR